MSTCCGCPGRASQARTPTLMAPPGPVSSGGRLDAAQQPGLDLLTLSSTRQSQPCFPDLRTAPSPCHQWDPSHPPLMSWADRQTQAFPLTAYTHEFEDDPHVLLMYNNSTSSSLAKPPVCLRPA